MWGLAGVTGSRVLLRIEDHDRERSRPAFDAAIIEDLDWLGFEPDAGPVRQRDDPEPYEARARSPPDAGARVCLRLHAGHVRRVGRPAMADPGRGPAARAVVAIGGLPESDDLILRVDLGPALERWQDRILGPPTGDPTAAGDPPIRDRHGNWTYGFAVVVDDLRQAITLVVRGEDLAEATAAQIRLGRLLGRDGPPAFAHHPLIRKPGGAKLSKADGDTGVRDLRAAGWTAAGSSAPPRRRSGWLSDSAPVAPAAVVELVDLAIRLASDSARLGWRPDEGPSKVDRRGWL